MQNSLQYNFWERYKYEHNEYDFIVLGAGFSGLSAAISIKKSFPQASVLVIDKLVNQSMASTRNAGFLCMGSPSELLGNISSLSQHFESVDSAMTLMSDRMSLRWKGFQWILEHIAHEKISLTHCGGREVYESEEDYHSVHSEMKTLLSLYDSAGIQDKIKSSDHELTELYPEAYSWTQEYQLNPALLRAELVLIAQALGIEFLYGMEINHYTKMNDGYHLEADELSLKCKTFIKATNAFMSTEEVQIARNVIMLTQELEHKPLRYNYHMNEGYVYFRSVGNRLLIGGARNIDEKAENSDVEEYNDRIVQYLLEYMKTHILPTVHDDIISEKWIGFIGTRPLHSDFVKREGNMISLGAYNGIGVCTAISLGHQIVEYI